MSRIETCTGQEWHTSYGAKGYVFVAKNGNEEHLYQSDKARLTDQDWVEVQRGKHGKWCEAVYEVPDGTILKLFAIGTWRGRPNGGGSAYFVVDSKAPEVVATGGSYQGRGGSLQGHVRRLTLEEVEAHGIKVPAKFKRYYKDDKITIKEVN